MFSLNNYWPPWTALKLKQKCFYVEIVYYILYKYLTNHRPHRLPILSRQTVIDLEIHNPKNHVSVWLQSDYSCSLHVTETTGQFILHFLFNIVDWISASNWLFLSERLFYFDRDSPPKTDTVSFHPTWKVHENSNFNTSGVTHQSLQICHFKTNFTPISISIHNKCICFSVQQQSN